MNTEKENATILKSRFWSLYYMQYNIVIASMTYSVLDEWRILQIVNCFVILAESWH